MITAWLRPSLQSLLRAVLCGVLIVGIRQMKLRASAHVRRVKSAPLLSPPDTEYPLSPRDILPPLLGQKAERLSFAISAVSTSDILKAIRDIPSCEGDGAVSNPGQTRMIEVSKGERINLTGRADGR